MSVIRGNMASAASGQGGAMVRVDPARSDALVDTTSARIAQMGGRPMPGWLRVSSEDLRTDDQLLTWVQRGTGCARSLRADVARERDELRAALESRVQASQAGPGPPG
ncbi:MAG TPA: hypothetical protein VEH31_25700, partial [Streptosporangiaceae bacterium]|nr:hypothetical protein [Streptosporangiaceae bacterium]